jgi:rare lipoprotein A
MKFRASSSAAATLSLFLAFSGCSRKAPADSAQTGVASWYGHPFHGRLTANGEIYDMEKMTAAHRTLPFGTILRVESLATQKTTEVRINDRGPFVKDRIIDLSHAAAQSIAMPGVASVRLQIVSMPVTRGAEMFAVQIGAFPQRSDAETVRVEMQKKFETARLIFREGDQTWRVLVGMEPTEEAATALGKQIDPALGPAFVVQIDDN